MSGLHDGRVALVTGGDSGIGRGICEELAREGAAVVIADIDAAEDLAATFPQALAVRMDITDESQVADGFATARDAFGPVDLLINNAGIEMPQALVDMPLGDWKKVLDVTLTGPFLCAREAAGG